MTGRRLFAAAAMGSNEAKSKQKNGRKVNELWDKVCSAFPVDHRSPVTAGLSFIFRSDTTIDVNFCRAKKDPITVSIRSRVNSGDVCVALASENWMTERMHEAERSAGRM